MLSALFALFVRSKKERNYKTRYYYAGFYIVLYTVKYIKNTINIFFLLRSVHFVEASIWRRENSAERANGIRRRTKVRREVTFVRSKKERNYKNPLLLCGFFHSDIYCKSVHFVEAISFFVFDAPLSCCFCIFLRRL